MRTFVRALAFIAVFGIGLLLLLGGAVLIVISTLLPQPAPISMLDKVAGTVEEAHARDLRMSGALLSMVGFVLTCSGIILAAVRPRQREVAARPFLGNAAVLASMAQARPAVAPAPDPMPDPQAPPAGPAAPTFERAMPVSAAPKPHAMKTWLWAVGIALIGIGLLVAVVGIGQHNPQSSSRPGSYTEHGFYSSSRGDATAIIAGGVLILITGAGLVVVAQFLRRGGTPER